MKIECSEHGTIDRVELSGYSIGHNTNHLTERDLEGVTFVVEPVEGEQLGAEHISSDADAYLEKFAQPYEKVATALREGGDAIDLGVMCDECGIPDNVTLIREDG